VTDLYVRNAAAMWKALVPAATTSDCRARGRWHTRLVGAAT
jgi:hypothetical protein